MDAELVLATIAPILTESEYFAFLPERPENSRFELRSGELVPMSPNGYAHARRQADGFQSVLAMHVHVPKLFR